MCVSAVRHSNQPQRGKSLKKKTPLHNVTDEKYNILCTYAGGSLITSRGSSGQTTNIIPLPDNEN